MGAYTLKDGTVIQDEDPNKAGYDPNAKNTVMMDTGGDGGSSAAPPGATPETVAATKQMYAQDAGAPAREAAAREAAAKAAAAAEANRAYEARFQYGGHAGGAAEAATRYKNEGDAASTREGVRIDYGNANQARGMNLGSRGGQLGMAQLMDARARGLTPSIAGMMADRQMGQAAAEQSSAAASARGPAALALAQQGAAANTAAMQSNISNQAQINAANERMQAEQAAFGAYTGMRGGDQALQGQDAGQATEQARLEAEQRRLNDAMKLGMTGFETGVQKTQLDAQGNKVGIETGVATANANRSSAESMHDSDRTDKYLIGGAGLLAATGAAVIPALLPSGGSAPAAPGAGSVAEGGGGPLPYGDTYTTDDGRTVGGGGGSAGDPYSDERTKRPASLMARSMGRMHGVMLSDDKTKLAAAWDQGHSAALANVEKVGKMTPAQMKALDRPEAKVARSLKADAYDEGKAAPRREMQSFQREQGTELGQQLGRAPTWLERKASEVMHGNESAVPLPGPMAALQASQGPAQAGMAAYRLANPPAQPAPQPAPAREPESPGVAGYAPMASRMRATVSDERTKDVAAISAQHDGGGSVGSLGKQIPHSDMAEFARSMRGVPYAYKPEFADREGQAPDEVNVGPVAQEMEKSKVGATIVKPDPQGSGMRTLDQPKMLKGIGAVVADQQQQLDELHSLMARRLGRGAR